MIPADMSSKLLPNKPHTSVKRPSGTPCCLQVACQMLHFLAPIFLPRVPAPTLSFSSNSNLFLLFRTHHHGSHFCMVIDIAPSPWNSFAFFIHQEISHSSFKLSSFVTFSKKLSLNVFLWDIIYLLPMLLLCPNDTTLSVTCLSRGLSYEAV